MTKQFDALWFNGKLITCEPSRSFIEHGAIGIKQGQITWMGAQNQLPSKPEELANHIYDLEGRCLTTGFIDCHTHLVYAGNRAHEFELRLQGVAYEEIARQGGGIQSTVNATRAASYEELFTQSLVRARALLNSGVTSIEIKSGYGL